MSHAPIARIQPGPDPYQWLEQRDADEVLDYLKAENDCLDAFMADQADNRELLFQEIRSRIRETDLSLPSPRGDWLYYKRTQAGDEYPRYYRCRRPEGGSLQTDPASETLLLDLNLLAQNSFLSLGTFTVSPDHRLLAYSLDNQGNEIYRLYLKDLSSNAVTELPFDNCDGSLTWSSDSRALLFGEMDETQRPWRIHCHTLGQPGSQLLYEEADGRYFVHCYRSSSDRQLVILSHSKTTSEARVAPADAPTGPWLCLAPREEGHEYFPDHGRFEQDWQWLIRSNQSGINYALFRATEAAPLRADWQELFPHDPQVTLEDVSLNAGAITLSLRDQGLPVVEVHPAGLPSYRVRLPDATYSLAVINTLDFDSPVIRLHYESLNRPAQIRRLHLADGSQEVLKETPVEGPFDPDDFVSLRHWAIAPDGARVPISLVAHRDTLALGKPAPLYLYGYGAYGHSLDPWFSHARLSLLERGFVFAIAHVRGGGDMGESWYRDGKLEHKANTFSDFIACSEHLIEAGLTTADQLVISGGSAGGLLIGAVLNQRPELFGCAIAEVPFVDVLNTMLNPDLPLTVTEYDEWGDPNQPEVRERIQGYAPYENVQAQAYPPLLVVAGYHDSRVQYWEAAKWVAKLRATRSNEAPLLLKTEFGAGHGGMSGRYQALRDVALEYAFICKVLGCPIPR